MKKALLIISLLLIPNLVYAGQIIERKNFYNRYDPISTNFVYSNTGSQATGDEVAVNTYRQKSIQITAPSVREYIQIRIEGRSKDQLNTAFTTELDNFAVLDVVEFGAASEDTEINQVIDVTEYVDFLRVGIRQLGTNGNSHIDVEGIFTNIDR